MARGFRYDTNEHSLAHFRLPDYLLHNAMFFGNAVTLKFCKSMTEVIPHGSFWAPP